MGRLIRTLLAVAAVTGLARMLMREMRRSKRKIGYRGDVERWEDEGGSLKPDELRATEPRFAEQGRSQ